MIQKKSRAPIRTAILKEETLLVRLLQDEEIRQININVFNESYFERNGKKEPIALNFVNNEAILKFINKFLKTVHLGLSTKTPFIAQDLNEKTSLTAFCHPKSEKPGLILRRKLAYTRKTFNDLLEGNIISQAMVDFINKKLISNSNFLVFGNNGSGRSTFAEIIGLNFPSDSKVLNLDPNTQVMLGSSEKKKYLQMLPQNIIELRDFIIKLSPQVVIFPDIDSFPQDPSLTFIACLNILKTQINGIMNIGANSTEDILFRLELLNEMAGSLKLNTSVYNRLIASTLNVVIQTHRLENGQRIVKNIFEFAHKENKLILQPIF